MMSGTAINAALRKLAQKFVRRCATARRIPRKPRYFHLESEPLVGSFQQRGANALVRAGPPGPALEFMK